MTNQDIPKIAYWSTRIDWFNLLAPCVSCLGKSLSLPLSHVLQWWGALEWICNRTDNKSYPSLIIKIKLWGNCVKISLCVNWFPAFLSCQSLEDGAKFKRCFWLVERCSKQQEQTNASAAASRLQWLEYLSILLCGFKLLNRVLLRNKYGIIRHVHLCVCVQYVVTMWVAVDHQRLKTENF